MTGRRLTRWCLGILLGYGLLAQPVLAEDGYDLWLRYPLLSQADAERVTDRAAAIHVTVPESATVTAAVAELKRGIGGLTGHMPARIDSATVGTLSLERETAATCAKQTNRPPGSYSLLSTDGATAIRACDDSGLLYGSFAWLRRAQTGQSLDDLKVVEAPAIRLRMLDHWDNPDGTVERGYAGPSIFDWWHLPDYVDAQLTDYARANASIGINGAVLNNVNASADQLEPSFIAKAAAIAKVLRPYGIRVYLSARFSSPKELGGLTTADPLNPAVKAWWQAKTDEIYQAIPDFGGFLVKANSEGQPGPQDYGRSHADGANMLAAALAPHDGIVMWRAFVYSAKDSDDRAKQAYAEFKPLDGEFADNVLLQVKNGPIDFQPREPFHPLFGAMPKTPMMVEFQITKEYLGFATHLVYLGPMWAEVLGADTFAKGEGSTVAKVVDGALDGHRPSGIAGVSNIGADRNWTGSDFDQANWYAFGRLAWNPSADPADIAREWAAMTFSRNPAFVDPVVEMMLGSRQAAVDYMTPLGLAHQMATGHHYGPGPWIADLARPEWNPAYYNRADASGIGFDRTQTGSNAVAQYAPPVAARFADPRRTGDDLLLWFHHLPWDYRLANGDQLWPALIDRYDRGVATVAAMRKTWAMLAPYVDHQRYERTSDFLSIQEDEARWWRDASIAYFASVSGLPLPAGTTPPAQSLDWYKAQKFPYAPGEIH